MQRVRQYRGLEGVDRHGLWASLTVTFVLSVLTVLSLAASALATLPVGSQFRISKTATDGDAAFDAGGNAPPALAYNSKTNLYLTVWNSDDTVDGESEIYGRFVDPAGAAKGGQFRISDMGPNGNTAYNADYPAVAYNPQSDEFLVVWHADDNSGALADEESEVYGQRISGTGEEIGDNDFRISSAGTDGNVDFGAFIPDVVYNSQANEYLVTWTMDDAIDNDVDIYGQRLKSDGSEVGSDDFRISDAGPDGSTNYLAFNSRAAYSPQNNEYLVVWWGDDNEGSLVDDESEIFGQRVAADGSQVGSNDFRISDAGPDGQTNFDAVYPSVTYNGKSNEYLVTWYGDDNVGTLVDGKTEVFVQRLSASGVELGANDVRISDTGPDGDTNFDASSPTVVYNSRVDEYLIAWQGDDTGTDNELEVFAQRLDSTANEIGSNDFRVSQMGPDGDAIYDVGLPKVDYSPSTNQYLVTWSGDDNSGSLVDGENEIYGRRVGAGDLPVTPSPPPPVLPAADKTAPKLTLVAAKRQRAVTLRSVKFKALCDEQCTLSTTTQVLITRPKRKTVRARAVKRTLPAGASTTVKVSLARTTVKLISRSLRKRGKAQARLTITAIDKFGNKTQVRRTVTLTR